MSACLRLLRLAWPLATVILLLARPAWSEPVQVQVNADQVLRGGTVSVRLAYGTDGPWQRLGVLTGLPITDTYTLELGHRYQIKIENADFWTIHWGQTEFETDPNMRNYLNQNLYVKVRAEPPATNVLGIVLKLGLPLLVLVAWKAWSLLQSDRRRERQFQLELQQGLSKPSLYTPNPSLNSSERTPLPQDLRVGAYRVAQKIGSGGMATIYAVGDAGGAQYALKIPHREVVDDPESVARFDREIKICVGLVHPNIVRTFDAGTFTSPDGETTPYMVMELVNGRELVEVIRTRAHTGQLPDLDFALHVADGVLTGLAAAHERGIIHRDIKPSNIMVTESGVVKIMDFGIARHDQSKTITKAAAMMGTPEYMAPEQVTSPNTVDYRADLYSTGVMLYSLVTYQLPYEAKSDEMWALMMEKLTQRVVSPGMVNPNLPMAFDHFIMRLMEIKPENRPSSAKAALRGLQWVRAHPYDLLPDGDFDEAMD